MAAGILCRNGHILLSRRSLSRRSFPDCWDLIGGHLEAGESSSDALVREVQEEVGVTPRRFRFLLSMEVVDRGGHHHGLLDIFRVDGWLGGEPFLLGDEHSALLWLSPKDAAVLPDLALDAYRRLFESLEE